MNSIQIWQMNSDSLPSVDTTTSLMQIRTDTERFPHFATVPQTARIKWLATEILRLHRLKHIDSDAKEVMIDAGALERMMMMHPVISDLTQPEIVSAFRNGLFGLYGEYYGINSVSMYNFLLSFINSDLKMEVSRQKREEKKRAETEQMTRKIRAEIEEAKRNGTYTPSGNWGEKTVDDIAKSIAAKFSVK